MTLRHYQAFVAVCTAGSMSKAAETLFISQSAVSQLIKDLEQHYSTTLFYRVSHKLILTSSGKKLYNHALHMVLYNQTIERNMSEESDHNVLRIGTINPMIILDLVESYKKEHPDMTFTVTHSTSEELKLAVSTNQLDFAITEKPSSVTDTEFKSDFMAKMPMTFVCSKNSKLSGLLEDDEPHITVEELARFPLFAGTLSDHNLNSLRDIFAEQNLSYNIAGQFLDYTSLIQYIFSDYGLGLVNYNNFYVQHNLVKPVIVEGLELYTYFYILQRNGSVSANVKNFVDFTLSNFQHVAGKSFAQYFIPTVYTKTIENDFKIERN